MKIATDVVESIGNIDVVELHKVVPRGAARTTAKLESGNPTGIRYLSPDLFRGA